MKVTEDSAKGIVILGLAAVGVYIVWKLYGASSSIGSTVAGSLGNLKDAATSLLHDAQASIAGVGARTDALFAGGAVPGTGPDQTEAEAARLARQEGEVDAGTPKTEVPDYDAMGNYQGTRMVDTPIGVVPPAQTGGTYVDEAPADSVSASWPPELLSTMGQP